MPGESQSLINEIKKKKELSGLNDQIVRESLKKYEKKYKLDLSKINKSKLKPAIKEIRSELRILTGRFQKSTKNREKLLAERDFKKLLKTHSSTAERVEIYPRLKKIISSIDPDSILDLACGLNPIALAQKNTKYYASDIKEDELKIIKKYFELKGINGETFFYDLRKPENPLPSSDLCLLFKVLDILGDKNLSERILSKLMCKKIIVSFSTRKLSGKKMNFPARPWFESILKKLNYPFKKIISDNELFYIIEKSSRAKK